MDGQRVEQKPGRGKKPWIIAGCIAALLLAAYLGLCAWAGSLDTIFPGVYVAGLDVSGMTAEQAEQALNQAVAEEGADIVGTLTYGGWRGSITAAEMGYTWDLTARMAYEAGRGNFLSQGGHYLLGLAGRDWSISAPRGGEHPALEALLDRVEDEVAGTVAQATYRLGGSDLFMTKGRTGLSLERSEVRDSALSALEEAMARKLGGGSGGAVEVERQLFPEETPPREPDFDAIYKELYAEAVSAKMDPETFTVTDHVVGVDFDPAALKAAYDEAGEGATFSIPVEVTMPKETRESLEAKLFCDVLGESTTRVTGSANRKHNVKLAGEACNGVIILPGEEFSYNNTTGSRTADKGYKDAPTYVAGESVNNIGGGVCQPSSTIYHAVLHSALEVVERRPHQFKTSYLPAGMDANVWFGRTDFRFKNNTDYPVKIVTRSYDSDGKRYFNVKLYGTNPEGVYAVPKSTEFDWVAPGDKYLADETVPRGTLVLDREQNAYTGVKATTYRYIYDRDGNLLEKQDMGLSRYAMRDRLYRYNPLDGDPTTWVDGKPPQTTTDPDPTTEPGAGTDPGTATEPAAPEDPGAVTSPETPDVPGEVA